jgi:hypothetical protein
MSFVCLRHIFEKYCKRVWPLFCFQLKNIILTQSKEAKRSQQYKNIKEINISEVMIHLFELFLKQMTDYSLHQGSQTQIHGGATFGWKVSLRAAVMNTEGSAGHNMENMQYFVQSYAIFDLFLSSMIKISNFISLKESLGPHKHLLRATCGPRAACLRPLVYILDTFNST